MSPAIVGRSLLVAAIVGTVLNLINQGDVLVGGGDVNWWKAGLTYVVPFCVATYGAYCAIYSGSVPQGRTNDEPQTESLDH